jgi:hypothetical protein
VVLVKLNARIFQRSAEKMKDFFKNLTRIIGTLRDNEYTILRISRSFRLRMRND